MKKYLRILLLAFFVLALSVGIFLFTKCSSKPKQEPINIDQDQYVVGTSHFTFDNYYFFVKDGVFCYQLLGNENSKTLPIYHDTLAKDSDNPFPNISIHYSILVDPIASSKNEKEPVLILEYSYIDLSDAKKPKLMYRIVSFNMETQKLLTIKDRITSPIQSLALYDGTIFFTTNEGDHGYDMHSIRTDGTTYRRVENEEKNFYRILYVSDNRVYYYDEARSNLYSANLSFEDETYLFQINLLPEMFIHDGYIYYGTNSQFGESNGNRWIYHDICRRSVQDPTKEENVLSKVTAGLNYDNTFYYYSFDNVDLNAESFDSIGLNTLYAYNLDTKEERVIFDFSTEKKMKELVAFSDRYLILRNITDQGTAENYSYIDLTALKETELNL